MIFYYNSTRSGGLQQLPAETVAHLRAYLVASGYHRRMTCGELMDMLLAYRKESGGRLLINHLEPIYSYIATFGDLWPE